MQEVDRKSEFDVPRALGIAMLAAVVVVSALRPSAVQSVPEKPKASEADLLLKDLYTEAGVNYRYFLTWRQLILGGYVAILGALGGAAGWLLKESPNNLWFVCEVGILMTSVFWIFEIRNREIYRACAACGKKLEKDLGVYATLRFEPKMPSQSFGVDVLFGVMLLSFLVVGATLTWVGIAA